MSEQGGDLDELISQAHALAGSAREPAAVGNILTGTASWTDKTLIQSRSFYPRGQLSAAERLAFYAQHFRMVEVDATYYAILPVSAGQRWVDATPPDFQMSVKAHAALTGHPVDWARLPQDLRDEVAVGAGRPRVPAASLSNEVLQEVERRFLETLEPLSRAGKLSAVLYQFPPWFRATRGAARQLELLRARHPSLPMSIEFRHPSWLAPERRDRVFKLLAELAMSYVAVDEPAGQVGGVPGDYCVTNPRLTVLRMHGRNRSGWRRGAGVHERFNYVYSRKELEEWISPVRSMAEQAEKVHVVFNNCVRDFAILGAKGFAALASAALG